MHLQILPPSLQQANALVMELLGKPIPSYLNRLASFGSFFSCFLPADMTSQAPVNQGAYRLSPYLSPTHTPLFFTLFGGAGLRIHIFLEGGELPSTPSWSSPPLLSDPQLHTNTQKEVVEEVLLTPLCNGMSGRQHRLIRLLVVRA